MNPSIGGYAIEGEIGRGAMGRVYRARHLATGEVRALKVLDSNADPELVVRFRREAEALGKLDGDDVVPIHDSGVAAGRLYFAMDLMNGGSLEARLKQRGKLPWVEAVPLIADLARKLARCHERGVIHRDLKPANVLFDAEGRPRLVDFGLARTADARSLTETGTAIGSPGYMSPESFRGEGATRGADVFSLGVVLYELLTGVKPYDGSTAIAIARDMLAEKRRPASELSELPPSLDRVIARALAADPLARYSSAEELAAALEDLDDAGAPPSALLPVAAGVGLALVLIAGVAAMIVRSLPRGGRNETAAPVSSVLSGAPVVSTVAATAPPTPLVSTRPAASVAEMQEALTRGDFEKVGPWLAAATLGDEDRARLEAVALKRCVERNAKRDFANAVRFFDVVRTLRPEAAAPAELVAEASDRYVKGWATGAGEIGKMEPKFRVDLMRLLEIVLTRRDPENDRGNARTLVGQAAVLHTLEAITTEEALRWAESALRAVPESSGVRFQR
ncbi:MAG: protein kinase, partial [Planctomycetota bacterium]